MVNFEQWLANNGHDSPFNCPKQSQIFNVTGLTCHVCVTVCSIQVAL